MTHPPSGPSTPPPPSGPKDDHRCEPLDPASPEGRAVAARLTCTLAAIELEIGQRKAAEALRGAA